MEPMGQPKTNSFAFPQALQMGFKTASTAISKVARVAFALFLDILCILPAGALMLLSMCKVTFFPKDPRGKEGKPLIVLLHGSNFNRSQWAIGAKCLSKANYGAVHCENYAGWLTNRPEDGIDDYAKKIAPSIKAAATRYGTDQVIFIGHSMGGMIATYYAEYLAEKDGIQVSDVMDVASPLQGSPTIDTVLWTPGRLFRCLAGPQKEKRLQQMSLKGGPQAQDTPLFRTELVQRARASEAAGRRRYYNIFSTVDIAVPLESGALTQVKERERTFNYLGHLSIVAAPPVWKQLTTWLDQIYQPANNMRPGH